MPAVTLRAAERLLDAMPIEHGDNYKDGHKNAVRMMAHKLARFKVLNVHKQTRQVLLRYKFVGDVGYMLVEAPQEILGAFVKNAKLDVREYADKVTIIGRINCDPEDTVQSIWVHESYRRRGIGTMLYRIAHFFTPKVLKSSNDLGTMSLGVWMALFKSEPKMYISFLKTKYQYSDVKIDGFKLFVEYNQQTVELTNQWTADFTFVWPK